MPSTRSGWTTERQCSSIMIATACSTGSPCPHLNGTLDRLHCSGRVVSDSLRDGQRGVHQLSSGMDFVDHSESVGFLRGYRFAGHQHLHGLARRKNPRQEDGRAAAGGQTDHRLGLPEDGVVGRDDEVGADGHLAAAAVGHSVDGVQDRPAELAQVVENAIEDLTLAKPLLLGHLLALVEVAADGEGAVACAEVRMATRTEGRAAIVSSISISCAASAVVTALSAWGRFRVMIAMRPVGNVLDEYELIGLRFVQWRTVAEPLHTRVVCCSAFALLSCIRSRTGRCGL